MSIPTWSPKYLIAVAAVVLLTACAGKNEQPEPVAAAPMDTLVSADWLNEHLDDPGLVVLDCTVLIAPDGKGGFAPISGRDNYEAGHIPSAGFADLMGNLSDPDSPHQFAEPAPEQFSAAMAALGVGDNSRVVLYDANNSVWAARVWWMLRWIGFDRAALLDGGLKAWTADGLPLSTEEVIRPAGQLTVALRPQLIADKDEVLAAVDSGRVNIVDALSEEHYRGEMTMYARPGHIAGASNVSAMSLIDESGRYRSRDELAALMSGDPDERAITYCGGGIAASSTAFIMMRLGFKDVAVYTASLQEWAADPANPMEVAPAAEPLP